VLGSRVEMELKRWNTFRPDLHIAGMHPWQIRLITREIQDSKTMALPTETLFTLGPLLLFVWVLAEQLGLPLPSISTSPKSRKVGFSDKCPLAQLLPVNRAMRSSDMGYPHKGRVGPEKRPRVRE
jgi:hypothetical protein